MQSKEGIKTDKLNIGYKVNLIEDICLEVKPGNIVTLIGPNGCGKTTLLKTLTGELSGRGGVVYLDGQDRKSLSATEIAKRMSMVMTYKVKSELMTCREVVEIGRYPYTGKLGILTDADKEAVKRAMEWTDIAVLETVLFQKISDGQKQRVLLARAICQEPDVLILDEPTSFLDIRYKIDILQKIKKFAKEKNIAVLMSLHELEIARNISDVVVAIGEGKIQKIGNPQKVFHEDFIRKLYHLENVDTQLLGTSLWESSDDHIQPEKPVKHSSSDKKAKVIMIQGTMSNAGKSVIAAGLCRIFSDAGYKVAPFKSQNMALNSFITSEGLEMGRAQVMQAECARISPMAIMNPILLKPTDDVGSQVIVNGRVVGNMKAMEYFRKKKDFVKDIMAAFDKLSDMVDIIVVEGAGSPVEMNLKRDDIVNMGLADMIDAPVLLVGDIDRGGVFAQLLGTLDLLEPHERERVKGVIVNKFRGDGRLFEDGIKILEDRGNTKVVGVVPLVDVKLDDEDSLSERFDVKSVKAFDIAVIRLSHISNFTDFDSFEQVNGISIRYVESVSELGDPDMIIIPGSKNTISDLKRLKADGFDKAIHKKAAEGCCIFGICGGFQMLGRCIEDPHNVEGGGSEKGLCLLPIDTVLGKEKVRTSFEGEIVESTGVLEGLERTKVTGYEIHMGSSMPYEEIKEFTSGKTGYSLDNIYGTYIHGFFDNKDVMVSILEKVAAYRGKTLEMDKVTDYDAFKDTQYDILAQNLKESLDMDYIYEIMGLKHEL